MYTSIYNTYVSTADLHNLLLIALISKSNWGKQREEGDRERESERER